MANERSSLSSLLKINDKGWNIELFENKNNLLNALCAECNAVCEDPVELSCEVDHNDAEIYLHCRQCLNQLIIQNGGNCPIDNHSNPSISTSRATRRIIAVSKVYCPFSKQYKLKNIENNNIGGNVIDTIGDEKEGMNQDNIMNIIGCNYKDTLDNLLKNHLTQCVQKYNPQNSQQLIINSLKTENVELKKVVQKQKQQIEYQTVLVNELKAQNRKTTQQNEELIKQLNVAKDEIVALKLALNNDEKENEKLKVISIHDQWDIKSITNTRLKMQQNIITKTGHYYVPTTIFLKTLVSKGICAWKFKIIKTGTEANLGPFIGIWKSKYGGKIPDSSGGFHAKKKRYISELKNRDYVFDAGSGLKKNPQTDNRMDHGEKYAGRCKDGDVVEMCLNMDLLSLSFKVNGKDYGNAFLKIEKCSYNAAVSLFGEGTSVQLM
eukprot:35669_1